MANQTLASTQVYFTEAPSSSKEKHGTSSLRWVKRAAIALASVGCFGMVSLFLLAYADYDLAAIRGPDTAARIAWVWEHGNHLHYAVHIAQARLFDVCPCTRRKAAEQYRRASFHAITTRQHWVAANSNPQSVGQWVDYVVGPFAVGLDWLHDGVDWLAG